MRKFFVLLMACGFFSHSLLQAQNITPIQVKESRAAIYQWLSEYQLSCTLKGRTARYRFINLFDNSSVEVFNDYLPDPNYDFKNTMLPLQEYVDRVQAKDTFDIRVAISSPRVISEKLKGDNIVYQLIFTKSISFYEKDNYEVNSIVYPFVDFKCVVQLSYNLYDKEMKATGLSVTNPMKPFCVLHDDKDNRFVEPSEVRDTLHLLPILTKSYQSIPIDKKVKVVKHDTLQNALGSSVVIGKSFLALDFTNNGIDSFFVCNNITTRWGLNYFRQLWIQDSNRIGLEAGLSFGNRKLEYMGEFSEEYSAIDPDGMEYIRLIDVDNYHEIIDQTMFSAPITLRYDRFFNNYLGAFGLVGLQFDYARLKMASAHAATYYRGYYEGLFGIIMDQNGVYDFGRFELDEISENIAINPFSVSFIATLGGSVYWKNLELDLGCRYWSPIVKFITVDDKFHLTERDGDWTSSTFQLSRFSINNIGFLMQIKYNF